ncbi:MAG TPA: GNAT family protein [Gemmataceae bacterium]|jgi:ribosomal-protein-alanine N-acetyltransferase|nr:GNAT family protein [Gemmataceae bacterium]
MPGEWLPPTLETPRLILRGVTEADVDSVFDYAHNPIVSRYTLWEAHADREATLQFLREYVKASYLEHSLDPLGICLKERPDWVIGSIGCRWNKRANRCMEMGFALGEPSWGRGITAEAARAVLDYEFANTNVERVQAHCMIENRASERVMQKLGMKLEGTIRSGLYHRGRFWDLRLYSILRGERR